LNGILATITTWGRAPEMISKPNRSSTAPAIRTKDRSSTGMPRAWRTLNAGYRRWGMGFEGPFTYRGRSRSVRLEEVETTMAAGQTEKMRPVLRQYLLQPFQHTSRPAMSSPARALRRSIRSRDSRARSRSAMVANCSSALSASAALRNSASSASVSSSSPSFCPDSRSCASCRSVRSLAQRWSERTRSSRRAALTGRPSPGTRTTSSKVRRGSVDSVSVGPRHAHTPHTPHGLPRGGGPACS
jgi:hypothetical protein